MDFAGVLVINNLPTTAGDTGSIPGLGRPLEEEMASSILAWKIPWTEEPGGLQPMGSKRVRHDSPTEYAHIHLCYNI